MENKEITPDEKLDAATKATAVILEYMGTQKDVNDKITKGVRLLNWLMVVGLIMSLGFIGVQIYNYYFPPASQVTLEHIQKQSADLADQQSLLLTAKEVFLEEKKAFIKEKEIFVKEKADFSIDQDKRRRDLVAIQNNILKQDTANRRVVNAETINTKNLNIKK